MNSPRVNDVVDRKSYVAVANCNRCQAIASEMAKTGVDPDADGLRRFQMWWDCADCDWAADKRKSVAITAESETGKGANHVIGKFSGKLGSAQLGRVLDG
jgi:hypothetical protein